LHEPSSGDQNCVDTPSVESFDARRWSRLLVWINTTGSVMSPINSVGGPEPSGPVQKIVNAPIHKQISPAAAAEPRAVVDKLELSGMSHLLQALKSNDIRAEKVQQIKAQIEAGTYEDEQKLDIAVDRLLDELQNG
jgi:anti-sigma28 factor (negative regulator of flagellin synthesis)